MRRWAVLALVAGGSLSAAPAPAQTPDAVPPPRGIVETTRMWSLGAGVASVAWDDDAPYDDVALVTASIERLLWTGFRGRGIVAYGTTDFRPAGRFGGGVGPETRDAAVRVWSFDLELLVEPAWGPLRDARVLPYAMTGVGTLVTDYTDAGELTTRNQSQWSYGGGLRARLAGAFEARVEGSAIGMRLADPFDVQNRETDTIHNTRWEGQIRWRF